MSTFITIWIGQFISVFGTTLTGFALGVWVFQQTGSATKFTLISLATLLPGVILSPVIGVYVDRWDRRHAMILSDTGAALCTLGIFLLLRNDSLAIWHIYLLMSIASAFSAIQWPAFSAATTLLVPKDQLGRASGMVQTSQAAAQITAPIAAALLIGVIQLHGVILVDFITFIIAVGTLIAVRVPAPPASEINNRAKGSIWQEALFGWRYIYNRRGLLSILAFFVGINFGTASATVLIGPLVLSFSTTETYGIITTVGGMGMLIGGLLMSAWGGPKRHIYAVLGFALIHVVALILLGIAPNPYVIAIGTFLTFFAMPVINANSQAIWQTKVEPDVQGRVFSVRHTIAFISIPLAFVTAGPMADYFFEPLMAKGGPLALGIGQNLGTGPGRGIGLMCIIYAGIVLLVTLLSAANPRMLNVEQELPDAVQD